jgi:parallel beta-helix repeat protein
MFDTHSTRPGRRASVRVVIACVVGAIAALAAGPVDAATSTIYVDQAHGGCSDAGPGTETAPLCTISEGAARAAAGTMVLVSAGTYDEAVTVESSGTASAPISFQAEPGESVIVSGGTYGFRVASESWITIAGFDVRDTTSEGIRVTGSSHVTIAGNEVSGAGTPLSGETAKGISLTSTTTSSTVTDNDTHHNSDAGIYLASGSTGNVVTRNRSWMNAREYTRAAAGIDVRSPDNEVSANITFDNEDSGVNIWDGADRSLVVNNLCYRNGDHGIDNKGSDDTLIVSNTVYGGVDSGIEVVGSSGVALANNISVDNGIDSPRTEGNIRVDAESAASIALDFDLVHLSTPGVMVDWAGTQYSSLAAFVAATGKEPQGVEGDPKFSNPSAGNFQLKAGSPALDSANSGAPGHPSLDALGRDRKDDPGAPNTGSGPRTYDDRGAFERQPK